MGEHLVRFPVDRAVTFVASTPLTGGQLVEVTGNRQVGVAGAGSATVVGSASQDAAVGDAVPVTVRGPVDDLVAAGTVAAGDRLEAATDGRVQALTTGAVIGVALTAAAAAGDVIQVLAA